MTPGNFLVIEGLEGAGKTTATEAIKAVLTRNNIKFISTREPGGTPLAEQLRTLVKTTHEETLTSETELLLMYASRVQLVENVIKPALAQGIWVIGDRHDLSSQAYQGGGRQLDRHLMSTIKQAVLKDFKPDLTLYMDIEPELGMARVAKRGEFDRIELEDMSFFHRVRQRYLELAHQDDSIKIIDASQSIADVTTEITDTLQDWMDR